MSQNQSIINYNQKNQKKINLAFYPPEHDLYEWLKTKPNVNGYIKRLLIQERMKEQNANNT
jgi:hypothetical protein